MYSRSPSHLKPLTHPSNSSHTHKHAHTHTHTRAYIHTHTHTYTHALQITSTATRVSSGLQLYTIWALFLWRCEYWTGLQFRVFRHFHKHDRLIFSLSPAPSCSFLHLVLQSSFSCCYARREPPFSCTSRVCFLILFVDSFLRHFVSRLNTAFVSRNNWVWYFVFPLSSLLQFLSILDASLTSTLVFTTRGELNCCVQGFSWIRPSCQARAWLCLSPLCLVLSRSSDLVQKVSRLHNCSFSLLRKIQIEVVRIICLAR